MNPAVLVTGATGFVGSYVVGALAEIGYRPRALVRASSDVRRLVEAGFELAHGDVTDPASLDRALGDGVGAVVHVAGLIKARDEAGYARVNVFGSRAVADACIKAGVRRVVHVSSLSARGPSGGLGPVSPYGRTKLAGEGVLLAAQSSGLEVIVVRPGIVYGPRDLALLPIFRLAKLGLRPILRGGGRLAAIHVEDLARALAVLVTAEVPSGAVFEATDGGVYSWSELVGGIAEAMGRPGPVFQVPAQVFAVAAWLTDLAARVSGVPQVFGRDKLAEMRASWTGDSRALWAAAGIRPRHDFASGSRATVAGYRALGWL